MKPKLSWTVQVSFFKTHQKHNPTTTQQHQSLTHWTKETAPTGLTDHSHVQKKHFSNEMT